MDMSVARQVISVIREQRKAHMEMRETEEDWRWFPEDEFLFNDLCLMLLVTLWHQVERDLVWIAGRITENGEKLTTEQYAKNVKEERGNFRDNKKRFIARMRLEEIEEWGRSMKTLLLLANLYKHDPEPSPDEGMLNHLEKQNSSLEGAVLGHDYDALPECPAFRRVLAVSVDLPDDADYCDIADELLRRAELFLRAVKVNLGSTLTPRPFYRAIQLLP